MTTFTVILLALSVFFVGSTLFLLIATKGFEGKSNRVFRILALVFPAIGVVLDASYHFLVDRGYELPQMWHSAAEDFLLAGVLLIFYVRMSPDYDSAAQDEKAENS